MATEVSDVSKPFMSGIKSMETTHKPLLVLRCKVVVVGDSTVGKSALVQMFHSGGSTYPRNYVMTTWVDFSVSAPPTHFNATQDLCQSCALAVGR